MSLDRDQNRERGRHLERRRVPHGVAVSAVHLRVSILNELQYRSNFFLQIFQTLLQTTSGLVVVGLVYDKIDELNGWRRSELLAAIGVFTIVGGIMRAFIQPPVAQLMEDIHEGTFDFTLTRPVDAQLLTSVRSVNIWQLADVVVGIVIVAVAAPDLPSGLGVGGIAAFLGLLAAGATIAYTMWIAVACAAFWVIRLPFIDGFFFYVVRAAQFPISIYPTWLRIGLTTVVPLGIAVSAPAEAITSRLTFTTVASAVAVTLVMLAFSRALWNRGIRTYTSASS
jgi:ABC-2 type transport system permease protein